MKFLKWAGSKFKLTDLLLENIPNNYDRYIEPFVGSGALLFALCPTKAIVSDLNCHLINTYDVIKNKLEELLLIMPLMRNEKEYFYETREKNLSLLSAPEQAARFIYLNKTCFNGLYRENASGKFNVPYGFYKSPKIYDENVLGNVSRYLNQAIVEIYCQDYKKTLLCTNKNDFIYIDSPYHSVSKTSFTKYTKKDFKEQDQRELAEEFKRLNDLGCFVMLSNANTSLIRELYKDFCQIELVVNRVINSKGDCRKGTGQELLIKNY